MLAIALTTLVAISGGLDVSPPHVLDMYSACTPHVCRMPTSDTALPKIGVEHVRATLEGRASWYAYVEGGAAAGPKLRKMLGKDWRGQKVDVCVGDDCIEVTLSDWCQCYKGEKRERIIDLDVRAFDALGDPGDGLMRVTVREQRRPAHRGGGTGSLAAVRVVPTGVDVGRTVGGPRPTEQVTHA